MNLYKVATGVLAIALVGSNVWWAAKSLDEGITRTYLKASMDQTTEQLAQALALLPVVARPAATKEQVIAAARVSTAQHEPYEKHGFVWVGSLGLKFNSQGGFEQVTAVEPDPKE